MNEVFYVVILAISKSDWKMSLYSVKSFPITRSVESDINEYIDQFNQSKDTSYLGFQTLIFKGYEQTKNTGSQSGEIHS